MHDDLLGKTEELKGPPGTVAKKMDVLMIKSCPD